MFYKYSLLNCSRFKTSISFGKKITAVRDLSHQTKDREAEYDVVIVGGGIIGAASARELINRHPSLKLAIVEKENKLAAHQSGHNSGVIHAGIYYKPGSLKAKLCVEGIDLVYKYCDDEGISYKKCGKLIVATERNEIPRLLDLHKRCLENEVPGVQLVDEKQIKEIEPYCKGIKALWSPHTGIVDWGEVTQQYGKNFVSKGGKIYLNFEVKSFTTNPEGQMRDGNCFPVKITSRTNKKIRCKYVLTCGGLQSDRLAKMSGSVGDPHIVPFRGEYLLLKPEKSYLVRGNIYPVPDPRFPFLGVHFTPRMNGDIWLGPNAVLAMKREGYSWGDIDLKDLTTALKYRGFQRFALKYITVGAKEVVCSLCPSLQVKSLQRFIPEIMPSDVMKGPSGVRAQAMNYDGSLVEDFVFQRDLKSSVGSRILHCRNAPSPGATSSLAIAKMITDKFEKEFDLTN